MTIGGFATHLARINHREAADCASISQLNAKKEHCRGDTKVKVDDLVKTHCRRLTLFPSAAFFFAESRFMRNGASFDQAERAWFLRRYILIYRPTDHGADARRDYRPRDEGEIFAGRDRATGGIKMAGRVSNSASERRRARTQFQLIPRR